MIRKLADAIILGENDPPLFDEKEFMIDTL